MGIINITPDSFSEDGCLLGNPNDFTTRAVTLAQQFIRQGADLIDIGGESSHPGSKRISIEEELKRILPVIKILVPRIRVPISVDTYKPAVAQHALDAGASLINNIKGIQLQKPLLKMVKRYDAAIVLMHMRGTPQTMQRNIFYKDLMGEIISELRHSIEICLEIGIKSDKIIIDPGIGFGKNYQHNLEILNHLDRLKILNQPILIGPSRKSFIGHVLNKDVKHRLLGTAASICFGIYKGAHIVRAHDVKEIFDVVKMTDALMNQTVFHPLQNHLKKESMAFV